MLRLRSVAGLCSKAASAAAARSTAVGQGSAVETAAIATRNYAVLTAAGAGIAAAGGTMTMRIFGYNVPYPVVLASALTVAGGVYWYECVHVAREKEAPLKSYMEAAPHIRSLELRDQDGKLFTAKDLFGKFAVVTFGTLGGTDTETVTNIAKAAESVKQRSGSAVTPVFITLDPAHDKPEDLKRLVQSAASTGLVALTGDPDGLLTCANKFKKQELSVRQVATKDQETLKKGDTVDDTYVSSYVYVVNPNGDFVSMMSKNLPADKMSNQICLSI